MPLPAYMSANQRVIRMPENEYDKSTIISVIPKEVIEHKPTLFPGRFVIPAADKDKFSLIVVGSSSWWKEMEEGMPLLEIRTESARVANSVVSDFCNGIVGCDMGEKMPGLFWIPGEWTSASVLKFVHPKTQQTFAQLLDVARNRQRNWMHELVNMADVLWVRTSGNPLAVDENMKMSALYLGLDKPWMKTFQQTKMENCKACGTLVNPGYPVCPNCKAIVNAAKATELGIKFAS